jgi:uncharacterized membrane protein YgcG
MNGFIKTVTALCLGSTVAGCYCYRDLVDPCWPERYNHQARTTVIETLNAQAYNGHILDQTIWNWHFVRGPRGEATAVLHPAGIEHLKYLVRRQPCPDPKVFLQTAQDVGFDPADTEATMKARSELDGKRQEAVHQFLTFATSGRPIDFQVVVIDPGEVGIAAIPIGGMGQPSNLRGAVPQMYQNFTGSMPGAQGGFQSGAAGGSSSAGGGSGGGGMGGGGSGGGGPR